MLSKESRVSFFQSHCSLLFSGKCGKYVSSILIFVLFISGFTFSSSAASQIVLTPQDFTITWSGNQDYGDGNAIFGTSTWQGINFTTITCSHSDFYGSSMPKGTLFLNISDLDPDTRYRLSFQYIIPLSYTYTCDVWLGSRSNPAEYQAYSGTGSGGRAQTCEFTFAFHNQSSNNNTIMILFTVPSGYQQSYPIGITDITITNLDDNTGLIQSIIDWLSRIYHSIAGGTDTQGVFHTGIVTGISNAIQNISTWLSNLGTVINNKLEAVKTALKNAIDSIQGWLITLGEDLVDGLKALFIPSEDFIDDYKSDLNTWLTNHFGALYQAPILAIDFIRELLSISNGNGIITLPDIRVEFFGHTYTILESQTYDFNWVNNTNHVLHTFYSTYRAFTYIILIVGLLHYLRNKYYQVFASMNDNSGGDS